MRVDRSLLFLDLCGFTAYTAAHGDREAVAIIATLRASLRAAAERHGVRVTKWLGDGAMVSGVDSAHVAASAVEVREVMAAECPLPVRGGLAQGPVILFEGDDYIGAAVNTAARLCAAASPNQLLATAAFGAAVEHRVSCVRRDDVAVRGMVDPVAICELGALVGDVRARRERRPRPPARDAAARTAAPGPVAAGARFQGAPG